MAGHLKDTFVFSVASCCALSFQQICLLSSYFFVILVGEKFKVIKSYALKYYNGLVELLLEILIMQIL